MAWDGYEAPKQAIDLIKEFEGFRAEPYDDNGSLPGGTWTIGYGATRDLAGDPVKPNTPAITKAQANELLQRDLSDAVRAVRTIFRDLEPHQAAGLISFSFNLAPSANGMKLKAPTLVRLVLAKQWAAAANQFKEYRNQGGHPVLGLRRRRWAEAAVFMGVDPVEARKTAWERIETADGWMTWPVEARGDRSHV